MQRTTKEKAKEIEKEEPKKKKTAKTTKKAETTKAEKKPKAVKAAAKKTVTKKTTSTKKNTEKPASKSTSKTSKTTKVEKASTTSKKASTTKKASEKKAAAKKEVKVEKKTTKKTAEKKVPKTAKKAEENKTTKKVAKKETAAKATKTPKVTKKESEKEIKEPKEKTTKKVTKATKTTTKTTKKTPAKVASTKKTTKSKAVAKPAGSEFKPEYYDLPYKYNQTVVKLLAQTPKKLFIYWEISDADRESFVEKYGEYFFNDTKPVIIIHNLSKNYSFEVDINDFANCWYIDINDPDCLYDVELGRRPITINEKIQTPYIYITSSNDLQSPNNHILFENIHPDTEFEFKNTKTKQISKRALVSLSFLKDMNAIYRFNSLLQFYKKLYGENLLKELADTRLNNPSSGAISSFK